MSMRCRASRRRAQLVMGSGGRGRRLQDVGPLPGAALVCARGFSFFAAAARVTVTKAVERRFIRTALLRIELAAWNEDDVTGFLAQAIARVGGDPDIFPAEAAATLARFAGGVPRTVSHLAQLALAAAAGDGLDRVDAAAVERAWRELSMAAAGESREAAMQDDGMTPSGVDRESSQPRVRVVRRLWG